MRRERRWKWLSVVLTGLLGFAVAMPSAVAHTTDSVYHMVEHIYDVTTSTQRTTGAIEQQLSALPDDPASTTDITEATQVLFDAVGKRGFSSTEVGSGDCTIVVPEAPQGTARLAMITLIGTQADSGPFQVWVQRNVASEWFSVWSVDVEKNDVLTFVETATEGATIRLCVEGDIVRSSEMAIRAQWDDRPMVHVSD